MNCTKCGEEMEFEEIKNFHGIWMCCECDEEFNGSRTPCAAERDEDGHIQITDVEERLEV